MDAHDKHTIRKNKLLQIIEKEGSQTAVAKKIGTDKSYLSQILSAKGTRNVGDDLARRIESAYGLNDGWLDEPVFDPSGPWRQTIDDFSDFVLIPRFHASASLGPGMELPPEDEISGHLAFKHVWLQKRRLNPRFLTIIDALGDSMMPTIADGDVLLVDLRQKEPIDNRIFVLRMNQQLYAKRLQVRPDNHVLINSDNPTAPSFEIDLAEETGLDIIGRVVWAGRDL